MASDDEFWGHNLENCSLWWDDGYGTELIANKHNPVTPIADLVRSDRRRFGDQLQSSAIPSHSPAFVATSTPVAKTGRSKEHKRRSHSNAVVWSSSEDDTAVLAAAVERERARNRRQRKEMSQLQHRVAAVEALVATLTSGVPSASDRAASSTQPDVNGAAVDGLMPNRDSSPPVAVESSSPSPTRERPRRARSVSVIHNPDNSIVTIESEEASEASSVEGDGEGRPVGVGERRARGSDWFDRLPKKCNRCSLSVRGTTRHALSHLEPIRFACSACNAKKNRRRDMVFHVRRCSALDPSAALLDHSKERGVREKVAANFARCFERRNETRYLPDETNEEEEEEEGVAVPKDITMQPEPTKLARRSGEASKRAARGKEKPAECKVCGQTVRSQMPRHAYQHMVPVMFSCSHCPLKSNCSDKFRRHSVKCPGKLVDHKDEPEVRCLMKEVKMKCFPE